MAKLVLEVEVQSYNGPDEEMEVLATLAHTLTKVVSLCDLAVGTFVKTAVLKSEGE